MTIIKIMTNQDIESRQLIIEQTQKEDERSDLKQHADKMLRDFEKFNDSSSNRAIWELVQNACDLTNTCNIVIDYRFDKLSFTHNGKPFNTKSLISLIKQVSGKYGDQEDIPEVGKYGTGFLTTHSFGRKFVIDSILDTGSYYIPINNFEIDRSPKTWEALSDNISAQKKKVYDILNNESSVDFMDQKTRFTFLPETSKEFEYIEKSQQNLEGYIPLVFTVNDRLKKITIIHKDNTQIEYTFKQKNPVENDKGINLFQTIVERNSKPIHVYSIIDHTEEVEIILPVNKDKEVFNFAEGMARLFLYYPLIGSENFGINFIINSKKFLPTEPRDGLHLKSDKDQVKDQEEQNRGIIAKCTDIIFNFLNSNAIEVPNPLLFTNIMFKTDSDNQLLNDYFKSLQEEWNARLQILPFVKTIEGYKTIQEVQYFSEDFLDDENLLDCFYELIAQFYHLIPIKEEIISWSRNAINWQSSSLSFIKHADLLEQISRCNLADFNSYTLQTYYLYLINNGNISVFNDYSLIPNIMGVFNKHGHFLLAKDLNTEVIALGEVLIPEKVNQLVHNDFIFNFTFPIFNQRNFSDEVKNELDKLDLKNCIFLNDQVLAEGYHSDLIDKKETLDKEFFYALFNFCKLSYGLDAKNKPVQLIKLIAKYYNLDDELSILPVVDEKERMELRSIRKALFEVFLNLISTHTNEWVERNIDFIFELHKTYDDSNKDIFKSSSIYPNQLFELCLSESLKRDSGVKQDIKNIYREIIGEDINEKLSLPDFNSFIPEENTINNRYLTTIIEDKIFNDGTFNIEDHPYASEILKIIPKLNSKEYQNLFPQLNDRKASIMISVVTKEETKDDIFAIVTLDDEKLKSIGKLISNPNFESILNQAIDLVEDERQRNANFQFKRQIGTHIEEKLKDRLKDIFAPEDIKCDVVGEQDGQDIILKIKGDIRYYIEVKSRWDKKNSIRMSKNQTIRSNEKKEIYALCSVDMTDYNEEDRYEIDDITKVFSNIKFITDIGIHVEHLVDVLRQTDIAEEIHLDGDYRTLVPQDVVNNIGIPMDDFETFLIDLLK